MPSRDTGDKFQVSKNGGALPVWRVNVVQQTTVVPFTVVVNWLAALQK